MIGYPEVREAIPSNMKKGDGNDTISDWNETDDVIEYSGFSDYELTLSTETYNFCL